MAGQSGLSPELQRVCRGAQARRACGLCRHFRLLRLRGHQSKPAEEEPPAEKEVDASACGLPHRRSPWSLAALHPWACGGREPGLPGPVPPAVRSAPNGFRPSPSSGGLRPAQNQGGSKAGSPLRGSGRISGQMRFLHGRPVETEGAPGRVGRGGLGQGHICGMPRCFTTLGPTSDLTVTAPHCADRAVTGPRLPPSSHPCHHRQGDRPARAPAPPPTPAQRTPPSHGGRHPTPHQHRRRSL